MSYQTSSQIKMVEETYTITINHREGEVLRLRSLSKENKEEIHKNLQYIEQYMLLNLGDNFVVINMEEVINIQCVKDIVEESNSVTPLHLNL